MDFFKRHLDAVMMIGSMCCGLIFINGKFNDLDRRLVKIETIMFCKEYMHHTAEQTCLKEKEVSKNNI